jgi:hypothetical protein
MVVKHKNQKSRLAAWPVAIRPRTKAVNPGRRSKAWEPEARHGHPLKAINQNAKTLSLWVTETPKI